MSWTLGRTARQRRIAANHQPRPSLDRSAARYMVYRVHDAAGRVLYVGRSCNVAARLRAHYAAKAPWIFDARRVSMTGPFIWDRACAEERREIEANQPSGNRMFTEAHGWRPRPSP